MQLWTFHTLDYCLVSQATDHSKCDYCRGLPSYPSIMQRLEQLLRAGPLVWCYTIETASHEGRSRWILDVPVAKLHFVHRDVWHKILGREVEPPQLKEITWRARILFPDDAARQLKYESKLRKCYERNLMPSGDPWNHLVVAPDASELVNALVPTPIPGEWVIDRPSV